MWWHLSVSGNYYLELLLPCSHCRCRENFECSIDLAFFDMYMFGTFITSSQRCLIPIQHIYTIVNSFTCPSFTSIKNPSTAKPSGACSAWSRVKSFLLLTMCIWTRKRINGMKYKQAMCLVIKKKKIVTTSIGYLFESTVCSEPSDVSDVSPQWKLCQIKW